MNLQGTALQTELLKQLSADGLTAEDKVEIRCRLAKELEDSGNYEAATGALGGLWQGVGERPAEVQGFGYGVAAEVLLRVGALSGWIGSSKNIPGAQEKAKDLISESQNLFDKLGNVEKAAEAQVEIGYCYWRAGEFDEARVTIDEALKTLSASDSEIKAVALIRKAIVEMSAGRLLDAEKILLEAAPFIETFSNHLIRANLHSNLAIILKDLGGDERRDRAFIEFAAANYHFQQAGHLRYQAYTENNLGFLCLVVGKYSEAHSHLERAKNLFRRLGDKSSAAQVDETRARVHLAELNFASAERAARSSVAVLEKSDEKALLVETLTTHASALARLCRYDEARIQFERANQIAIQAGEKTTAGFNHLTMIEELGEHLHPNELRHIFHMADYLLKECQRPEVLPRLLECAKFILAQHEKSIADFTHAPFIYQSEETGQLLKKAYIIARSNAAVLISGETGTGKEVLARLIHQWSGRMGEFVSLNCAAIPESLLESELFGHRKGAFTGAIADFPGAVARAAGGTLFLDEIGEMSLIAQAKILRLVEAGEIQPVGAMTTERINVRIVAATNRDLRGRLQARLFREDLFYRLETFHLEIPPLRERPDDIPALAVHLIEEVCAVHGKRVNFDQDALEAMRQLALKGNVRELRTLIERTVIVSADQAIIRKEDVEAVVARRNTSGGSFADVWAGCSLRSEVHRFEADLIRLALRETKGSVTKAARLLGISHPTLQEMLLHRHKELLSERTPPVPRKKSIITKRDLTTRQKTRTK